ncbi:hypothetical protein MASR2M117_02820 [Paludibacter sp.]
MPFEIFHKKPDKIVLQEGKQTRLAEKLDKTFKILNAYACNRIRLLYETIYQIAETPHMSEKHLILCNKQIKQHGKEKRKHNRRIIRKTIMESC